MKVGDIILIYARSETHANEVFPSVILGEFKVTELFQDTKSLFTAPPQMGEEVFPYRFRLKLVKIFKTPKELKPLIKVKSAIGSYLVVLYRSPEACTDQPGVFKRLIGSLNGLIF
ncbi:MAG: EVE domain-containing protein [Methanospirillum sp.]|uniref:EVE domain-containing protein n=1 Tax=Methanospirillum sp. TaxID=45200 RepID=UPI00236C68AE|nr:EVE domain-containing protein [Methanospirillum sp.]MDD1729453.1 EVE domain-containing protein [Methanospirillum sp.]